MKSAKSSESTFISVVMETNTHQSKLLEVVLLPRFCCCRVLLYISILDCLSDMFLSLIIFLQPLSECFFLHAVCACNTSRQSAVCMWGWGTLAMPVRRGMLYSICLFKNQSLRWAPLGINWGFCPVCLKYGAYDILKSTFATFTYVSETKTMFMG